MEEDLIDPSYDDAFAGLVELGISAPISFTHNTLAPNPPIFCQTEFPCLTFPSFPPTLPSLSSTPFPVPFASTHPPDFFGRHCPYPYRLSDNIASSFYGLTSASSALFSSPTNTLAPDFGIGRNHGLRCPQHSSTLREQASRQFFHSLPFSSLPPHRRPFATPGPSPASAEPSGSSFPGPSNFPRVRTPGPQAPNSDGFFLNTLAEGNFSSPSILNGNVRGSSPTSTTAAPEPPRRQSFEPELGNQGSGEGLVSFSEILRSSPPINTEMPAQRNATGSSARGVARPSPKRVRKRSEAATPSPDSKKRKHGDFLKSEDDPFGEGSMAVIDLANTEEVPAALKVPPKPKNMVRLGKFQCVVCMDDTTTITVTHCGHLFCGECLHSALHINDDKKICPICRQKVDVRPSGAKFSPRHKGYYPLQLKIMTKKSLGKRAENP